MPDCYYNDFPCLVCDACRISYIYALQYRHTSPTVLRPLVGPAFDLRIGDDLLLETRR